MPTATDTAATVPIRADDCKIRKLYKVDYHEYTLNISDKGLEYIAGAITPA
jgi:hypothetical protein